MAQLMRDDPAELIGQLQLEDQAHIDVDVSPG